MFSELTYPMLYFQVCITHHIIYAGVSLVKFCSSFFEVFVSHVFYIIMSLQILCFTLNFIGSMRFS